MTEADRLQLRKWAELSDLRFLAILYSPLIWTLAMVGIFKYFAATDAVFFGILLGTLVGTATSVRGLYLLRRVAKESNQTETR